MPSYLHELLLLLFRNRSRSAADLLREFDVQLPEYDEIRTESSDLSNLQPAEYHADLVLFLVREAQKVLGVIVEVQLGYDQDKLYTWPVYIANLRARHRCPVCLLVITIEETVARWADIDAERSRLYLDLILISLLANAPEAVEATMNSLGYEYQSDFARRYFGEGKAEGRMEGRTEGKTEGKTEGRVEIILKLLALRFGPLPAATQTRVRSARDAQLEAVAERLLTAQTLQEALDPLY